MAYTEAQIRAFAAFTVRLENGRWQRCIHDIVHRHGLPLPGTLLGFVLEGSGGETYLDPDAEVVKIAELVLSCSDELLLKHAPLQAKGKRGWRQLHNDARDRLHALRAEAQQSS